MDVTWWFAFVFIAYSINVPLALRSLRDWKSGADSEASDSLRIGNRIQAGVMLFVGPMLLIAFVG